MEQAKVDFKLNHHQEYLTPESHNSVFVIQFGKPNTLQTEMVALKEDSFIQIDIELLLTESELDQHTFSKIYYAKTTEDFHEEKTIWFKIPANTLRQTCYISVPKPVRDLKHCHFKFDLIPFCKTGAYRVHRISIGSGDDLLEHFSNASDNHLLTIIKLMGELALKSFATPLVQLLSRKLATGSFAIDYTLTNTTIKALESINDPESLKTMTSRLDLHNYHYQWLSGEKIDGFNVVKGVQNGEDHTVLVELAAQTTTQYLEIDIEIDIDWNNTRLYDYSKLYFVTDKTREFSEERVICFRVARSKVREKIVIKLPEPISVTEKCLFRIDPLPFCKLGRFTIHNFRPISLEQLSPDQKHQSDVDSLKQSTRRAVALSEEEKKSPINHLPESITLEITAKCDFTCAHCSSHGTEELHDEYNRMPVFKEAYLNKLAQDVFPALSTLTIVGRGEPSIVPNKYWENLMAHLRYNRTKFTMVTHGYHIPKRINIDNIDLVDTITISIDGITPETFAKNRGGKDLNRVLANAEYYHSLRKNSRINRRPRLCFSWTLLKNNIHEFPDFVRYVSRFEPDLLYVRHLLVYHDKDKDLSLFDSPELANKYLSEAYKVMEENNIKGDCPPLFKTVDADSKKLLLIGKSDEASPRKIHHIQLDEDIPVILGVYKKKGGEYIEIDIEINLGPKNKNEYKFSKLYYAKGTRRNFTEDCVLTFTLIRKQCRATVFVKLPFVMSDDEPFCFRLDPLVGCSESEFTIHGCRILSADEMSAPDKVIADKRYKNWELRKTMALQDMESGI